MIIDITPVPYKRQTVSDKWKTGSKKRPELARYHAFRDELRAKWGAGGFPERVSLTFCMAIPTGKKAEYRERIGRPHEQTPDLDNLVKAVLDALCKSDAHIYEIHAIKRWEEKGCIIIESL